MTNLRDYDRDATLIEKVRDLERQLADARESLDIAYAKGLADGRAEHKQLHQKFTAIIRWLEKYRIDVFRSGLCDAIRNSGGQADGVRIRREIQDITERWR